MYILSQRHQHTACALMIMIMIKKQQFFNQFSDNDDDDDADIMLSILSRVEDHLHLAIEMMSINSFFSRWLVFPISIKWMI